MILIHAYAQRLRNGMPNPKNYPEWPAVIAAFDDEVVQIGVPDDIPLVADCRIGLPLKTIRGLVADCDYWIAVDSFLPHLAHHVPKPGVVLWGVSDPRLFGYPENVNLLKDRSYLRPKQFRVWEEQSYRSDAFLSADEVTRAIQRWQSRRHVTAIDALMRSAV